MKIHSTNYFNTFIEVAEDSKAESGVQPISKSDKKTVAQMQFEMIAQNPYIYTSDDVLFLVFAERKDFIKEDYPKEREQFFSKGQPCLRASPLTKSYGFGVHSNKEGKVAIYGMETEEYQEFISDKEIIKTKAMRSSRK